METQARHVPNGYHTATPFLIVRDAVVALDFYKKAFGAKERMRHHDKNGQMRHCEIEIGDSAFMIGGQHRAIYSRGGPLPSVCIYLYVDDADSWVQRALASGAKEFSSVRDQYDGDRRGGVQDPFGIVWWIATRIEDVSPEEMDRRFATAYSSRCGRGAGKVGQTLIQFKPMSSILPRN